VPCFAIAIVTSDGDTTNGLGAGRRRYRESRYAPCRARRSSSPSARRGSPSRTTSCWRSPSLRRSAPSLLHLR